ncbi:MAG: MlaD family protein, partial [Halieaceae bacterium]
MSEKPHSVAIGSFIVGALLIAISGLIFIGGSGFSSDRNKVVMVFDGSVKGLSVGAPVALRGVQIGQVTDIQLIFDTDTVDVIMLVEAEITSQNIRRMGSSTGEDLTEELIARGMRGQLNTQSLLTGLLYVQLDFFPDTPINLADIETDYVQVPTVPTELERLTRELESVNWAQLANDMKDIAAGINQFIGSEEFQALPTRLSSALGSYEKLSDDIQMLLATSGPKLNRVLDGTGDTVETFNKELPKFSALAEENLNLLDDA